MRQTMIDNCRNILIENENLKKEIYDLKKLIDNYERIELELSTEIDFLREGIIK